MAEVWPVYEGRSANVLSGPWAYMPWNEALKWLGLREGGYIAGPNETPHFGDTNQDKSYAGYKHVIVKLNEDEADEVGWKPGFYRAQITPREAFNRLLQRAAAESVGEAKVVRVEHQPTTDMDGEAALTITIVLSEDAARDVSGIRSLELITRVEQQLYELGDERTPIFQFMTEEEIREDAAT